MNISVTIYSRLSSSETVSVEDNMPWSSQREFIVTGTCSNTKLGTTTRLSLVSLVVSAQENVAPWRSWNDLIQGGKAFDFGMIVGEPINFSVAGIYTQHFRLASIMCPQEWQLEINCEAATRLLDDFDLHSILCTPTQTCCSLQLFKTPRHDGACNAAWPITISHCMQFSLSYVQAPTTLQS